MLVLLETSLLGYRENGNKGCFHLGVGAMSYDVVIMTKCLDGRTVEEAAFK